MHLNCPIFLKTADESLKVAAVFISERRKQIKTSSQFLLKNGTLIKENSFLIYDTLSRYFSLYSQLQGRG
jgi:hypothetical protein